MPEGGRARGCRHAEGRVCTGILCLNVFICFVKVGVLGEGLNRICNSFPGVFFNIMMHLNEHRGELGILLQSASLPYFYL